MVSATKAEGPPAQDDPFPEDDKMPFWVSRSFPASFVVDRPYGIRGQQILFLHFRSPVTLSISKSDSAEPSGACVFLMPGTPHRFSGKAKAGMTFDGMCIPHAFLRDLQSLHLEADKVFHPIRTDFVPFTINQIRMEAERKREYWQRVVSHSISLILTLLARYLPDRKSSREPEPDGETLVHLRNLARQIDENVGHPWTVEEMAALLNLSRSRFSSIFTSLIGESPRDYLINARLRHAIILLTNSSINVAEAADQSGFQSAYYFSRIFHKRIGCPPSQYNDRFIIG
ncbi:MAG: AraC family transcriptional regulator [Verrucomicrobiota bacterium]